MTQTMILGAAAIAAAAAIGTIFLFQHRRKKQEHSSIMTFKELYEDNIAAEVII